VAKIVSFLLCGENEEIKKWSEELISSWCSYRTNFLFIAHLLSLTQFFRVNSTTKYI
jgi:hypothetical protein